MKHEQTVSRKNLIAPAACLLMALACGAGAQQASSNYRGVPRDPFAKRKFSAKPVKPGPKLVEPPPVETRIQQYKQRKAEAAAAQSPAPKPTTAFLLSELRVTGIFRTPRGWAAMVEADPIKLSYTVYPGEHFYNGMLVAIEESRLVFRRESRWTDGRREQAVEMKPLAQPNAVTDGMTTAANGGTGAPAAASPLAQGLSALLGDEATRKMFEELSRRLAQSAGANAGPVPNSPAAKKIVVESGDEPAAEASAARRKQ
jgi:hypothetical protein